MVSLRAGWIVVIAAVVLLGCASAQPPRSPKRLTRDDSALRGPESWTPRSALRTCQGALDRAHQQPHTLESSSALMQRCTILIADTPCRSLLSRSFRERRPQLRPEMLTACAEHYCPKLDARVSSELAACTASANVSETELDEAWSALFSAMLAHDFVGADLPEAMALLQAAKDFVLATPRPPPPSMAPGDRRPDVVVRLNPDHTFTVTVRGEVGPPLTSLEQMLTAVPLVADGTGRIAIQAARSSTYQEVIAAMDGLRDRGYEHVEFVSK